MRCIAISFIYLPLITLSQGEEMLSRFSASASEDRVDIVWTMKAGNLCSGIDVERTTDTTNLNPEVVRRINGVCGDERTDVTYRHADLKPVPNQPNYYRLILGAAATTYRKVDYTYFGERGVILAPQPAHDQLTVHFSNPQQVNVDFKVYNLNGKEVLFKNEVSGNQFQLNTSSLPDGIYLYRLTSSGDISESGKLMITR